MTDFQFCYWLQGLLELAKPTELNKHQVENIKLHLELVEDKKLKFTNWLSGFIDGVGTEHWDSDVITRLQSRLAEEFRNTIDPSYPTEMQESLYQAHTKPDIFHGASELIRC